MAGRRGALFSFSCLLALSPYLLGQSAASSDAGSKPALWARTTKAKYRKGEKVVLDVRIRNEGKQSLLLAPLSLADEYLQLRVIGPDGKQAPKCSDKIDGGGLAGQKYMIVHPGASVRALIRLSCNERKDEGYLLDQAGKYVVYADYHISVPRKALKEIAGAAEVWNGRIEAPPATFWITCLKKEKGTGLSGY